MAIDENFLDQLSRFNLVVHKRVTSNYSGTRKSISKGQGLLFEDHQQYTPGEDYRKIDWKVYARSDDLFIKRYEVEKNLTVRIVLDSSASMRFRKKWDYASMMSLGFAYLSMRENERFQLSTFDKDLIDMRAKKGRGQLTMMMDHLNSMKLSSSGEFLKNIKKLKTNIGSRSLIIIISDFLYDPEEIEQGLSLLKKHEVEIIQVFDEQELSLDFRGNYKFKDPEEGGVLKTFVSPYLKNKYQDEISHHIAKVRDIVKGMGGKYHLASTEKPIFDVFYEVLRGK